MNRIAELRKERHLNQIGLAMKLNISQYMVSAYETERHQISSETLLELADFFNVSVDYLLCRSNVRMSADKIAKENFSENELKLIDLYRTLSRDKQNQAIGIIFALTQD